MEKTPKNAVCKSQQRWNKIMTCPTPITIRNKSDPKKFDVVPCGRCYACRENRRVDWMIRLKEETLASEKACFVTLTYNDDNLELNENCIPSVWKDTLQKYIKRLRKKGLKFRYYAVGEYGGKFKRPHYHLILFDIDYEEYEILQNAWYNTETGEIMGTVDYGEVNLASIGYITKYHVNRNEEPLGANKEFTLMSRRPAIGSSYFKDKDGNTTKIAKEHKKDINKAYYQDWQWKKTLPRYYKDKIYSKVQKDVISVQNKKVRLEKEQEISIKESEKGYFERQVKARSTALRQFKRKSKLNQKL